MCHYVYANSSSVVTALGERAQVHIHARIPFTAGTSCIYVVDLQILYPENFKNKQNTKVHFEEERCFRLCGMKN